MIKILALTLLVVQIFTFTTTQVHQQDNWNWIQVSDLTNEQQSVQQWVRGQVPALSSFRLSTAARLGDQLQFHYDGQGNQGWDVITNGGKGDGKFIQRATFIKTEQRAEGAEVITKKHIVRNDFIKSVNDFS